MTDLSKRRGLTLVELLVLLTIFGLLASLCLPPVGSGPIRTDDDLALENWQPGPEHIFAPPAAFRVQQIDLTGRWMTRQGRTALTFKPLPDGRYCVSFSSGGGCGGRIQLQRIAHYENGVILFDRPVTEMASKPYQWLFSIRFNGVIYLIPADRFIDFPEDDLEIPYRGVFMLY